MALLGREDFDVVDVDASTPVFGPGAASLAHSHDPHFEDVNDDGFLDLVSHFRIGETGVASRDRHACLHGERLGGARFGGCDAIDTLAAARGAPH